jgi:transcriptional regulator with XRE-family HTH domain
MNGGNVMRICDILVINLKYYRKKYNLSQEKFAEIIGTSLSYLNQIENKKVDVKSSTIDKFARKLNEYDSKLQITSEDLVTYDEKRLTNYSRIDEKK